MFLKKDLVKNPLFGLNTKRNSFNFIVVNDSTFDGIFLVIEFMVCRTYIWIFKKFVIIRQNFITCIPGGNLGVYLRPCQTSTTELFYENS